MPDTRRPPTVIRAAHLTPNSPLIADTLAVRGLIYDERRGGYIANTPATFARAATDASISYARDALLTQSYQSIDAQGVSAEEAANSLGQPQPDRLRRPTKLVRCKRVPLLMNCSP